MRRRPPWFTLGDTGDELPSELSERVRRILGWRAESDASWSSRGRFSARWVELGAVGVAGLSSSE